MNEHLSALQFDIVGNSNINVTGLNSGGLHLNKTGTGKLAVNFIKKILKALKSYDRKRVALLINTLIFVLIVLFTRLGNKEMKILIKPFQSRKFSSA